MRDEATVHDLLATSKRSSLLPIEDFFLVHIHYVKLVSTFGKLALCIRFALDLKEEPALVSFCICIRFQVEIEFSWLYLQGQVKISTLKHGIERQVTVCHWSCLVRTSLIRPQCALINWTTRRIFVESIFNRLVLDVLWN